MSADSSKGFKDIIFGKAAAEHEKSHHYRKLLLEGFLDEYGYTDLLLNDDKFLVLGLKGSGKSAIAVRLELLSEQRDDMIVTNYEISTQFPFQLFSKLMDLYKYEAQITRFQYYWEYLILVVFLESFSRDDSLIYKDRKQAEKLIHVLKRLKLMPTMSLINLVTKTTREGFEANLDNILKSSSSKSSSPQSTIGEGLVFNILREVCYSVAVKNKHILTVDGLDSIMTPQIQQNNIITALIIVSDLINRQFMKNNIDAKVILLCRSDLFDFLPGANLNKIKQDSAIKLDWYQEGVPINSTNLVKLINLRTKIAIGRDSDFFSEFLPPSIYSDSPTIKTLLDNTRYRPRDLIQLLNVIQENTPKSKSMPDIQDVKAGMLQYSRDYLVGEIGNDLYGFLTVDEKNKSITLLSMMNKSIFTLQEIEEKKNNDPRFEKLDTIKILEALFDCGAILNFRKISGSKYSYTAKSRNPTARFDPNQGIRINWGLWRAFNIAERYDPDW